MHIKAALFALIVAGIASQAFAQANELLWRVPNPAPAEKMPLYNGEPSLFPQREEPQFEDPTENIGITPALSEEELRERERVRRAAVLLEEVRDIIQSDGIFRPDVSGIEVQGQIANEDGASKVLIGNEWLALGDAVKVPTRGAERAFGVIRELRMLDPELAEIVRDDIDTRIAQAEVMELSIAEINDSFIMLIDSRDNEYLISIIPAGW